MVELKVRLIEKGEFEDCGDEWERVLDTDSRATIFDTWEWFSAFSRHHEREDYHVLSVTDGSKAIAFAPLVRKTSNRSGLRITKIGFPGGLADYNGIIASEEMRPKCYASILNYLYNEYRDWDAIDLEDLPAWSDLTPYMTGALKGRCMVTPMSVCPYIKVTDWQSYLASRPSRQRRHIERAVSMVEEPGLLELRTSHSLEQLGSDLGDFFRLHLVRKPKSPFQIESHRDFLADVAHAFMRRGWLDLTFLGRRGETLSTFLGFRFRGRYYAYNKGLSPEARSLKGEGFGSIHLAGIVRREFESGIGEFDFMRGDEKYKDLWTDTFRQNSAVTAWNTRPSSALKELLERVMERHTPVGRFVRVLLLPLRLGAG